MFSLAALSKETAIVTPAALALWEVILLVRNHDEAVARTISPEIGCSRSSRLSCRWQRGTPITITTPASSSATPSSSATTPPRTSIAYRIALCLWHRLLHLTTHMNMFVPVVCAMAVFFIPVSPTAPPAIPKPQLKAIARRPARQLDRLLHPRRRAAHPLSAADVSAHPPRLRSHLASSSPPMVGSCRSQRRSLPRRHLDQPSLRLRPGRQPHLPRHDRRSISAPSASSTRSTRRPPSSPHGPPPPNSIAPNSDTPTIPSRLSPSRTSRSTRSRRPQPIPEATTSPSSSRPSGRRHRVESISATATNPPTQNTSTFIAISPQPRSRPCCTATSYGRLTAKESGPPSFISRASSKPRWFSPADLDALYSYL